MKIDSVEEDHIAYGCRSRYNDLIVGGLCDLETAQTLKRYKLVTSYVEQELVEAIRFAEASPEPPPEVALADVYV